MDTTGTEQSPRNRFLRHDESLFTDATVVKKKPIKKYCEDHIARRRSRTFKTCGEFVSRAQIVVGKKRCRETEEFSEACEKYAFCREELTVKRAAVYPNTFGSETPRFTTTALQPGGVFVAYTRSKGRRIRY